MVKFHQQPVDVAGFKASNVCHEKGDKIRGDIVVDRGEEVH